MTNDEIAALQQRAEEFIHGSTGGPTTDLIRELVAAIASIQEVTNAALAHAVDIVSQLRMAIDPNGALRDIKALVALAEAHRQDSEDVDAAAALQPHPVE